jgi:hypothetical protein
MLHSRELDLLAQALRSAADGDPGTPPSERIRAFDMDLLLLPDVTAEGAVYRVLVLHSSGQFLGGTVADVPGVDTGQVRREFAALLLPKGATPEATTGGCADPGCALPIDHTGECVPKVQETSQPAPEQPQREKTPLEKVRAAYMIALEEHCGAFATPEFRRGVEGALIGSLAPVPHPRNWEAGAYRSALEDLEKHRATCEGGDACTLRTMAAERFFSPKEGEQAPPFESRSTTTRPSATAAGVPGVSAAAGEKKQTNGGGSSGTGLFCGDCARAITQGQQNVAVRAFGVGLCPACQKGRAQVPAGAA